MSSEEQEAVKIDIAMQISGKRIFVFILYSFNSY
jgi:hypothetical protein